MKAVIKEQPWGLSREGWRLQNGTTATGMCIVFYLQAEKPACFQEKQTFLFHHSRKERNFLNRTEKYNGTDLHNADS